MEEAKYKIGDKFIIEINQMSNYSGEPHYYIDAIGEGFTASELDCFERYEPHDTAEQAWKLIRTIENMTLGECKDALGTDDFIFSRFSYQEVKEMIKAWKAKKELKIGDEVIAPNGDRYIVAGAEKNSYYSLVCIGDLGFTVNCCKQSDLKKTGRHFDLSALIEFLKGEDDD